MKKKSKAKKERRGVRGIWKGSISFGLVNIPVALASAQEKEKIHFRMIDKNDHSPIGYKTINKRTGKEISRKQIVKAFEHEKGEYVIFTEADFKKANVKATSSIDIEDFVAAEELDPLLFERPYYIIPQKGGDKGYVLLREVLKETGKVGVAKVVLHTVQHLAAIMPKGDYLVLEILRFADEIKDIKEVDYLDEDINKAKVSDKELKIATQLVEGMTTRWKPEKYENTYREDIMKLVRAKVRKGAVEDIEEVAPTETEQPSASVIDLTNLLEKSLNASKRSSPRTKRRRDNDREESA